jgi:hypothetical protein
LDLIEAKQQLKINTNPVSFGIQCQENIFYKAYVSRKRIAGMCELIILWKNRKYKKKLIVHYLRMSFSHEGVQEYSVEIIKKQHLGILKKKLQGYVQINLLEAAILIQDAYSQNVRFKTRPAEELEEYKYMLEYDTTNINRRYLMNKLLQEDLTIHEFTNIYLSALRRMDNALLYDCSSVQWQEELGDRNSFILNYGKEYRGYTFLRSGIKDILIEGNAYIIDVFAVVITAQEEIMKIIYNIVMQKRDGYYCVDAFRETSRENLQGDHPDNPFNYRVYCTAYHLLAACEIKSWLNNEPEVLVTGELQDCTIYKWLQEADKPGEEFNINDKILAEYIVTKDELLIFAKKPNNLIKAEKKAAEYMNFCIKLQKKYYMPVQKIYQYIITKGKCLNRYSGTSALIHFTDSSPLLEYIKSSSEGVISLGAQVSYFYEKKKNGENNVPCFKEYYLSKNWLKIYTYGEEVDKGIEQLLMNASVKDIVYDFELENYYDLFIPPITEQRKWYIYGVLQRFYHEANELSKYGVVPVLEDVLRIYGAVKTASKIG